MKAVCIGFFLLLTAFALLPQALSTKARAEELPLTKVAYTGDTYTLPPTGPPCSRPVVTALKDFDPPDVSNSGQVGFTAIYAEAPIRALFRWTSGSGLQERVADDDLGPAPYSSRCFQLSPTVVENGSTTLAFGATLIDKTGPGLPIQGVFLSTAPGSATTVVADGVTSPIGGTFLGPVLSDFDDTGRVLFTSNVVGGSALSGLFRAAGAGGPYTKVAAVGESAPGTGGGTFSSIGPAVMNNSGYVAFYATISGGGGGGGAIFRWDGAAPVQKVVGPGATWFTYFDASVAGDPDDGDNVTVTFTAVSEPRINDGGTVSFRGTASGVYSDGYFAVQPGTPPTTSKLALVKDDNPVEDVAGGSAFTSLSSVGQHVLENNGQVIVKGTMPGTVSEGLFSFPAFEPLAIEGQTAPTGGTFSSFSGGAVSEASSLAFGGTTDGPCPPFGPPCHGLYTTTFVVTFPPADTDGDGLYDSWEQNGIDANNDGTVDLVLPGANKNHKDIYVEVDYLDCNGNGRNPDNAAGLFADCAAGDNHTHQPIQAGINNVIAAFAAVPNALVNNPDGQPGITLHVTVDEAVAHSNFLDFPGNGPPACNPGVGGQQGISNYMVVKAAHFGTVAERANANTIAAKKKAYHYTLFTHQQANGNSSSGCGEIWGNDFYVSLGGWTGGVGTQGEQEGTFMHELGHNLNLQHGGGDGFNYKPNYLSVMNYTFQMPTTPVNKVATNRPLDYSRWKLLPGGLGVCAGNPAGVLNEAALDERCGIDNANPPAGLNNWKTAYTYYDSAKDICPFKVVAAVGSIDWNNNGSIQNNAVSWGINDPDSSPDDNSPPAEPGQTGPPDPSGGLYELCQYNNTQQLNGFADWSNLKYFNAGQGNFGNGLPNFPVPPKGELQPSHASAVGGVAELPVVSDSPARTYVIVAAAALAAAITAMSAGAWYARRRWLK